jgi:hypothetical protein
MRYIYIAALLLFTSNISAQTGFNHLTAKGGVTYEGAFNFEIGFEMNKKYFNNWSIFFSGYNQELDNGNQIKNWTSGVYYEPNLLASKNNLLNFKFGTSLGTNENDFIIDAIAGIEYNYAFSDKMKFTVFFKNNYMINSDVNFRHALLIGFKHRL